MGNVTVPSEENISAALSISSWLGSNEIAAGISGADLLGVEPRGGSDTSHSKIFILLSVLSPGEVVLPVHLPSESKIKSPSGRVSKV